MALQIKEDVKEQNSEALLSARPLRGNMKIYDSVKNGKRKIRFSDSWVTEQEIRKMITDSNIRQLSAYSAIGIIHLRQIQTGAAPINVGVAEYFGFEAVVVFRRKNEQGME